MDFDSFKVPTVAESSLLRTSSEDVNVVDNASTELAKDTAEPAKDDPKFGDNAPSGLSQYLHFFRKILFISYFIGNACCFGLLF